MRIQNHHILLLIIFALISLSSCQKQSPDKPEILVAAAANMREPLREIGAAFEAQNPVQVKFSFGATGTLARQIENGAPFELFVSADVATIDRLIGAGKLRGETKRIYGRGQLVLWTREGSGIELSKIDDLLKPEIKRLSVANPELAPYGRAAIETLTATNLLEKVRSKIVYGESVNQARQFAESGNAEAAFIPRSLTVNRPGKFIEIDEKLHAPIDQALALVNSSPHAEAAQKLADFITGADGRRVLERYGYK